MSDKKYSEDILKQARKHLNRVESFESEFRNQFIEDLDFYHGEQWDWEEKHSRLKFHRPVLVANELKKYCRHIMNDIKSAHIGITVKPEGKDAVANTAEMLETVLRYIERDSKAQDAYHVAVENQIIGGVGYIKLNIKKGKIYIESIRDPLNVYMHKGGQNSGKNTKYCLVKYILEPEEIEDFEIEEKDIEGIKNKENITYWEYFFKEKEKIKHVKILGEFEKILSVEDWQGGHIPVVAIFVMSRFLFSS